MIRYCKYCELELTAKNTIKYKPLLLCCTKCYKELQADSWQKADTKKYYTYVKNPLETKTCKICLSDFETNIKRKNTCSKECAYKWRLLSQRAYDKTKRK